MRPRLAVWKFSSCDGCQLSLLDCEDELLELAGAVDIAYFLEASSATVEGPYDLSLVEGSVTTPGDAERIYLSMERNMRCGVGHCGHCQLGPTLICRDGPVYRYSDVERWLGVAEL